MVIPSSRIERYFPKMRHLNEVNPWKKMPVTMTSLTTQQGRDRCSGA